jgi:type VI secretion system secreted protein Hcp
MKLFRSLFGEKCGVKVGKPSRSRVRPGVESLEDRCLAAVDAFIWFNHPSFGVGEFMGEKPGYTGETSSKAAFEIKDFSFGVENPTTIGSATGGAGAGKAELHEFVIKKMTDSASPAFFKNCVAGAHYKTVTIEMRKAGGGPNNAGKPFLQYQFKNVFVSKINWSGPGDEGPEEAITFVYGKLRVKYEKHETIGPVRDTVPSSPSSQPISNPVVTTMPPVSNPTTLPPAGNPSCNPTTLSPAGNPSCNPTSGPTLPG